MLAFRGKTHCKGNKDSSIFARLQLIWTHRHEAQGCSMRGALKRRLARTRNTLSQEVQVGPDFERNGGSLKQERTSTPEAETSSNVERPVSSYDMSVKTDGLETPSLFSPLLRDLEPRETGQLWSRPVTSGAYAFGQQEVAWNGYMPASYYTSSLDIQF